MIELTKERLMALSNRENFGAICSDEIVAMALQLLAGLEKEPVAYYFPGGEREIEQVSLPDDLDDEQKANCIPLYAAPQLPQPTVDQKAVESLATDLMKRIDKITGERHSVATLSSLRVSIVEACRAAILQGAEPAQPYTLRDGWVAVPVEPTAEMQSAAAGAIRFDTTPINKLWTGNAVYKAMIAAAPQQEVK